MQADGSNSSGKTNPETAMNVKEILILNNTVFVKAKMSLDILFYILNCSFSRQTKTLVG